MSTVNDLFGSELKSKFRETFFTVDNREPFDFEKFISACQENNDLLVQQMLENVVLDLTKVLIYARDGTGCLKTDFCDAFDWDLCHASRSLKIGSTRCIPFNVIPNLCQALGCSISYLFFKQDVPVDLPKQYNVFLAQISALPAQECKRIARQFRKINTKPFSTSTDVEARKIIAERVRLFTESEAIEPLYIVPFPQIRNKLRRALSWQGTDDIFSGRVSTMLAIAATTQVSLDYWLASDYTYLVNSITTEQGEKKLRGCDLEVLKEMITNSDTEAVFSLMGELLAELMFF